MIPVSQEYVFPPSNSISATDSYYYNMVRNETEWGNKPIKKYRDTSDIASPSSHKFSVDKVQKVLKHLSEAQRLENSRDMNIKGQDSQPDGYPRDTIPKFHYHKIYSGNTRPVLGLYTSNFH